MLFKGATSTYRRLEYLRMEIFLFLLVFEVLPRHQEVVVFLQTAFVAPSTKDFLMTLKYSVINIARHFDATFSQIFKMVAVKPTFVSIFLIGIWHFAQAGRVRRMDSSIIEVNGKLGMYLNVPSQCYTIYDSIIERLEACKSGRNLGHPNLDQGCLIQVSRSTVWKFSNFPATMILREINFGCHFINQN